MGAPERGGWGKEEALVVPMENGRGIELLGAEDVAGLLGVKESTVWRWCREGDLAGPEGRQALARQAGGHVLAPPAVSLADYTSP